MNIILWTIVSVVLVASTALVTSIALIPSAICIGRSLVILTRHLGYVNILLINYVILIFDNWLKLYKIK